MTDSFSVHCLSCNGRLRVTDPALIGTIVSCPRCGSMVQVVAPEQKPNTAAELSPPSSPAAMVLGSEPVDSTELTRDELSREGILSTESGETSAQTSAPPGVGQQPWRGTAITPGAPPVESPTVDAWRTEPDSDVPAVGPSVNHDLTEGPESLLGQANPSQRRSLAYVAIAIGCLLCLGLLAMWWLRDTGAPIAQQTVSSNIASSSVESVREDSVGEPETGLPAEDIAEAADETAPDVPPAAPATDDETRSEQPTAPAVDDAGNDSDNMVSAQQDTPTIIPADLLPDNPLVPNQKKPADDFDAGSDVMLDLPPELQRFTDLLDLPGQSPESIPTFQPDAPLEDLAIEQAAETELDPMLLATPPPDVDVPKALQLRVAIQSAGYPLAAMMLFGCELTQVPIQIDWVTLDLAGIDLNEPVQDTRPGWKPIGDLLQGIAREAGLVLESSENRLVLTLSEAVFQQRLSQAIATDDFGEQAASVRDVIDPMLEATQWDEREKIGLHALLIDGMRHLRSLPPRLPATVKSHWMAEAEVTPRDANALNPKASPADFPASWPLLTGGESGKQLDTSITLAGLLRRTARLNDAICIVDWNDVRKRRLSPGQLTMPFAGSPAGVMLDEALSPMGLQVRTPPPTPGHPSVYWWVGTEASYDRMPIVVLGQTLGIRRDEILDRIREAAAAAETLLLLEHDPDSDRYLALMPRFLYRQLPTVVQPLL